MTLENCVVTIGKFYEDGSHDDSTGDIYVGRESNNSPKVELLSTPKAQKILKALVAADYLNQDQSPKCSWALAAIIAREVGSALKIKEFYKVFEAKWNHQNLKLNLQSCLNDNSHFDEEEKAIKAVIASALAE